MSEYRLAEKPTLDALTALGYSDRVSRFTGGALEVVPHDHERTHTPHFPPTG